MSQLELPNNCVYLPLGDEVIPLLKREVVPLKSAHAVGLPWYAASAVSVVMNTRVTEEDYLEHMHQEYARLPMSLRNVITEDAFIVQAEAKRADIEAALVSRRKTQAAIAQGKADDWWMQRFFTDPYSVLAWQLQGFDKVWVGIDVSYWSGVEMRSVEYRLSQPASFPARLWCDAPSASALAEQRLVLARDQVERRVVVAGEEQGLVRIEPRAIRCILLGSQVRPALQNALREFWFSDFRYQRMPIARMQVAPQSYAWQFHPLTLGKSA